MTRRRASADYLQKIRDSINLIEIVGEHVVLRKTGANHVGLCPFHSERTPSFSVSETKQLYHCYGCKKGGDLFSFVMEIHGIGFPEAIEELSDRAKLPFPKEWDSDGAGHDPEVEKRRAAAREKLATAYKLNRFAAAFYRAQLPENSNATSYFHNRGVGEELQKAFYLGAAPSSWDVLSRYLVTKEAPLSVALELGLIRPSTRAPGRAAEGPGYFDLFRNRAIFPILDMRGRVAGLGGRTLPGGDENPKYLNSPESLVFQKSKLVFGLYQAQKHIREKDEVILVEGYFDVLALHAAGFQNVVASCGTALTVEHLAVFRRLASKITILFDGDQAGVEATERAMEQGLGQGLVLYGALIPGGADPDEILFDTSTGETLPQGQRQMSEILAGASPLLDARIDAELQLASKGPEARTLALKKIGGWLARFTDPIGREVRLQQVEKQMKVTRDLMKKAMSGALGREFSTKKTSESGESALEKRKAVKRVSRADLALLRGFLKSQEFQDLFLEIRGKLPPEASVSELFEDEELRKWVEPIQELLGSPRDFTAEHFSLLDEDISSQVRSVLTETLVDDAQAVSREDFKMILDRALAYAWARFSQRIKEALERAEAKKDAGLQSRLMKEYLDVQRKMKEFNSFI